MLLKCKGEPGATKTMLICQRCGVWFCRTTTEVHSIESAAYFGDANNEAKYLLLLSKASSSYVEKLISTNLVLFLRPLSQLPKS